MKVSGVIITYKLIAILLFESDIKFSNQLYFGIRLIKRAEGSGVLPQEQHSGRSGHTPIEVALIRSIFIEFVTQTKRNTEFRSYDAANLYGCLAQNISLITDKDFNIPLPGTILV